jgi:hypothetical protein
MFLNQNLEEETTQGIVVEQKIIKTYKDCISSKISNREFKILADLQRAIGKEYILDLSEELKIGTIEKVMEKSDLELGIESLKKYF